MPAPELTSLLERMRFLEVDHDPESWPAVQMKDITALCDMVEGAKRIIRDRLPPLWGWNPDLKMYGYYSHDKDGSVKWIGPDLEDALLAVGRAGA